MARAQRRLAMLQRATDSQLLRLKELEQRKERSLHRVLEMRESEQYRTLQILPPVESSTPQI